MTIRDVAIAFGFEVDKKSEKKVEQSVDRLKKMAKTAIRTIGTVFSLAKANALIEEFTQINQQLKNVVGETENFKEVQEEVLNAANNTKTAYATMSSYVKGLMNTQNTLFSSVEGTLGFAELTTKALKAAGANESAIASLNSGIQSAFTTGKVSAGTFQSLMETCPQSVEYLAEMLGISERQVKALGQAGAITANQLYSAFSKNADDIEQAYGNVAFKISDATTYIRNKWGMWLTDMNETLQITQSISKFMVRGFDVIHSVLKKVTAVMEKLNNRLGGNNNLIKLMAISISALIVASQGQKVLTFFKSLTGIIKGIGKFFGIGNVKIMLIAAAIMVIALLVEDFINFLKGNDSMFGDALSALGMNAEEVREQVSEVVNSIKELLGKLLGVVMSVLKAVFAVVQPILKVIIDLVMKLIASALDPLMDLIMTIVDLLGPLLDLITPLLDLVLQLVNFALAPALEILKLLANIIAGQLGSSIKVLTSLISPLITALSKVAEFMGGIFGAASEGLGGILGGITDVVGSIGSGIGKGIGSLFGLAEGGYIGANNPTPVVIGDNTTEGEIVSPISKMRNTFLDALNLFTNARVPSDSATTLMNETSNRTLTQNVSITNTFNGGSAEQQKNGAVAMKKSANDATGAMARGLAYAR